MFVVVLFCDKSGKKCTKIYLNVALQINLKSHIVYISCGSV